jgi:probable rRNA maturation factor
MKIWISNRQRKTALSPPTVRKKARKILDALGWADAELSLTLVSDRAMARLNRETFGRRGPTNVIAFPVDTRGDAPAGPRSPAPDPGAPLSNSTQPPPVLGEVVISLETTRRQAEENHWPWEELFDFYLIHGILHLVGHDHDTPENEVAMTDRTWELMNMIRGGGG